MLVFSHSNALYLQLCKEFPVFVGSKQVIPDFWEHLCWRHQKQKELAIPHVTYPVLEEPQTLVESIIQRYATRTTNEFDTAGATPR